MSDSGWERFPNVLSPTFPIQFFPTWTLTWKIWQLTSARSSIGIAHSFFLSLDLWPVLTVCRPEERSNLSTVRPWWLDSDCFRTCTNTFSWKNVDLSWFYCKRLAEPAGLPQDWNGKERGGRGRSPQRSFGSSGGDDPVLLARFARVGQQGESIFNWTFWTAGHYWGNSNGRRLRWHAVRLTVGSQNNGWGRMCPGGIENSMRLRIR